MSIKTGNKIYLSWQDVDELVEQLCKKILQSKLAITSITGIERGGLIPAVMISHRLNISYTDTIGYTTLVVDDICDSGETLKNILTPLTAVLHYKPHTADMVPSLYAQQHTGDEWIIYPWERGDSQAVQDYLKK